MIEKLLKQDFEGDKIDLSGIDANVTTSKNDTFYKPTIGIHFLEKFTKPDRYYCRHAFV